ncbi:hypothetical protein D915_010605 [Fasciola hepatica]|uniref:Uncharacterized protein n=1 Tax=Fasciola hepatica TaxID=6192 RepID=A0A4E0R7H4_FASHE|nr:hypothetical protein D915_010605 [Fasciola hepatica]
MRWVTPQCLEYTLLFSDSEKPISFRVSVLYIPYDRIQSDASIDQTAVRKNQLFLTASFAQAWYSLRHRLAVVDSVIE